MVDVSVSIVIPVYNQVEYTRLCLESLLPTVSERTEVVVIDNASSDGTADYLSSVSGIRVIANTENIGCAGAWNQGVRETSGDWIVILNNDVIVWPGWLEGLLHFAGEHHLDIVSPAFREGEYNYAINEYAAAFTREMIDVARFGVAEGICFMVRRSVFDEIGLFDENFHIGQCEDADFFRRARMAGLGLGTTGRSFLHHFGSVTQTAVCKAKTAPSYADKNRAYYRKKWRLTWWRRFAIRRWTKIRSHWWCLTEMIRHGRTLKERWEQGRLRHY